MEILELTTEDQRIRLLKYMRDIDWIAARYLVRVIEANQIKEELGRDARIFYGVDSECITGFFTIVNQDYIPLEELDRFIAMLWVDPDDRGKGLVRKFVGHAERESGVDRIYICTNHRGLYERMGYELIREFSGTLHGHDYLYAKDLRELD